MNKAYIISTDHGEVKDFVGEVLRYVEEQKNWIRGQARQYIGWSDMVQGETTIVAQLGKIDSTLFKDALKFAKTETKTDYKMARPDNYIGESRRNGMKRYYRCTIVFQAYDDYSIDIASCNDLSDAKAICLDMNASLAQTDKEEGQFFVYDRESGSHRNRNGKWEREIRDGEWEVE